MLVRHVGAGGKRKKKGLERDRLNWNMAILLGVVSSLLQETSNGVILKPIMGHDVAHTPEVHFG